MSLLQSTNHYVNNRGTLWSVTNHATSVKVCQGLVTEHLLSVHAHTAKPERLPYDIAQTSDLAPNSGSAAKKPKVIMMEVKFKLNTNRITEEIAEPRVKGFWLCTQRNLMKANVTQIGKKLWQKEKNKDACPREVTHDKKHPLKELTETLHNHKA